MEVLILGGAGMVGQKLLNKIIEKKSINGKSVSKIKLFDIVDASYPENSGIEIETLTGDISKPETSINLVASKPEIILTSNNLQVIKYSDKNGNTKFTVQNLDGTVLAENISRLELRIDFPEIEKKFES